MINILANTTSIGEKIENAIYIIFVLIIIFRGLNITERIFSKIKNLTNRNNK